VQPNYEVDEVAEIQALREEARGYAADLRARALAVDAEPGRMRPHLDSPGLLGIQRLQPVLSSTLKTAVVLIELAKGDAGMVLACPGPALAGVLVRVLGNEEQNTRLATAVAGGRTWAFLAITEPQTGSDATRLRAELRPDDEHGHRLHGVKRYIGNGSRGTIGVVLARTGPSPLSLRAALVEAPAAELRTQALDMIGLRGARISEMTFDGLPVGPDDLLGAHLSPLRRGMWGVRQAFNTVRVHVAAMAVGTAMAVHDYVRAARRQWTRTERADLEAAMADIEAVRRLTHRAAMEVDANRERGYQASMAKLAAGELAVRISRNLPRMLGPGALLEHPLLEKWWRDSCAFEFMEGTGHIQRLHVAQDYLKRDNARAS